VLLVRAGALGDVLLLRRVVAGLREHGAAVTLLAPGRTGAVLLGPGPSEVERVLDWDRADFAALMDPGAALSRRAQDDLSGFDLALVFSRDAALRSGLERVVPRVVGHDPAPPPGVHASTWLCAPLAALGIPAPPDPPLLAATEDERARAAPWVVRLRDGFLAVHPGSGSPAKNWGAERFAALVSARAAGAPWLLVEGPADTEAAAPLRALPAAVIARDLPLRVLGALLARCGLYVGGDSGVTHLAAACGAPSLALFGPTDPAQWAPVGPRVHVVRAPEGSLIRLEVDQVLAAARAIR
jgi:heptosyltransferase III